MRTIAAYNIKGGVGKTSTAVNLAYLAGRDGLRTLLWDLDPQAAATYLFRVQPRVKGGGKGLIRGRRPVQDAVKGTDFDNLDLLPADFTYRNMDLVLSTGTQPTRRLRQLLGTVAGEYDLVVLDCPPSVSLVSENVLRAADTLVVPLIPTTLSLRTFDQLTAFLGELPGPHPAVLAFFSMVDRRKKLHRQLVADLPGERAGIIPVSIPAAVQVEQMAVHRAPVTAYAPRSRIARDYQQLWEAVQSAGRMPDAL
jgi:cellulose biosynthesis protein BcsQ